MSLNALIYSQSNEQQSEKEENAVHKNENNVFSEERAFELQCQWPMLIEQILNSLHLDFALMPSEETQKCGKHRGIGVSAVDNAT